MANFYCDPTLPQAGVLLYSTTPVAAGTVPTRPEDGNGKAPGPAVMATRVITFTGQPTAGQSITVAGIVFSAVASGATGNQFNIGVSAAATATNFRNAVNASTTNVVNPTMAVNCPLRNAVNATGAASTITIYTRIAGSEWNSILETSTLSNVTDSQWSGGQDGAWGYFFNSAAISWPTSVNTGTYGAFPGAYLGTPSPGDVIHIRTQRSGANVVIGWPTTSLSVTARAVGTLSAPLTFLADAGIMWPGDSGVFILRANAANTANRFLQMPTTAGVKQIWSGVKLGENQYNWRHEITGALPIGNYYYQVGGNVAGGANFVELHNMEATGLDRAVLNNQDNSHRYFQWAPPSSSPFPRDTPSFVCKNLYFRSAGRASAFSGSISGVNGYYTRAIDCVNDHTGLTLASTNAIMSINGTGGIGGPGRFEAIGCKFLGFPAAANLSGFQDFSIRALHIILRDCEFTNIKCFGGTANGGFIGTAEEVTVANFDTVRSIRIVSRLGNRPSLIENSRWAWGWFDSAAPVVSTSVLPDGVTPFSIRCAVTTEAGNVGAGNPVRFPAMSKINSLSDGNRTARLRVLVDNNLRAVLGSRNPNNEEMFIEVTYVDTSNNVRTVSSRANFGATPVNLPNGSSSDWTTTSYDVNGVSHDYSPCEISVVCPNVKSGCEATLSFYQGCQSTSLDDLVFIDPEWSLT